MITLSQKAAEKVLESIAQADSANLSLRLAAKRLADGSFDYAMGLDQPSRQDNRVTSNGVSLLIAPTSAEFLRGATLDYVELEAGVYQFIFINPNDPAHSPPKK